VKGMGYLGAILLLVYDEYNAFKALINLAHSHHFSSFFRA
jgi:hypothetical protein